MNRPATNSFVCVIAALAVVLMSSIPDAAARSGVRQITPHEFWQELHVHEEFVIRSYRANNKRPVVRWRGEQLYNLQHSAALPLRYTACRDAARTLSMMVTGYVAASDNGQIALDWHYLAPKYQSARMRCLLQLDLDEDNYALPWWFGR